jgi:hypothetical protein
MAENYLVKVLIPTYFPFIGVRGRKQSRFGAGERLRVFLWRLDVGKKKKKKKKCCEKYKKKKGKRCPKCPKA